MLRPGDEPIPGYQLERFLGKGQFGQVWQSSSPGKASVALKFLNLDGKEGWREFRSIQQVKGIRHAHLMPITALWLLDEQGNVLSDDVLSSISPTERPSATQTLTANTLPASARPTWLVVAQLLGDETLADRMKVHQTAGKDGIPVDELLQYLEEAAKGIDFLNSPKHDLGEGRVALQHCDIKPANILLIGGSVLICDFGVTRTLAEQGISATATGMVGSPAYMSPECIERRPSPWSDQYSLAITYYELRTGRLPFQKLDYVEVLDAHRRGTLDFSQVGAAERRVLAKATSVTPKDRFPSTSAMVAELRRAVQADAAPRTARSFGKWGLAAMVAASALFLAIMYRPDPSPTPPRAEIQVMPLDAQVLIDDVPQQVSPEGRVQLESPTTDLRIIVRKLPEFEETIRIIKPHELASQSPLTIQLRGNATHFADLSQQQLSAGKFADAVATYAQAINIDSNRARFPSATVLQRPEEAVGKIRCVTASPDGKWLAVGTDGKFVRVWNLQSPDQGVAQDLQSHRQEVTGIALSRDALVSSDYSGTVEIYPLDPDAAGPRASLSLNPGILVAEVSRDGRWLVIASPRSADSGAVIQAWDLSAPDIPASGRALTEHELAVTALAISADSQWVISGSWDGTVRRSSLIEPTATSVEIANFSDEEAEIYCLGITRGRVIVGGRLSAARETTSENCLVSVALDGPLDAQPFPTGHEATVEALAVGQSGQLVASGGEDGSVQVWPLDERGLPAQPISLPSGHRSRVGSLGLDPSEQWLVSAGDDGQVLLWDLQGPAGRTPVVVGSHRGTVAGIVMLPAGQLVTAGEDGTVRLWNLPLCQMIKRACDKIQTRPAPADTTIRGTEI